MYDDKQYVAWLYHNHPENVPEDIRAQFENATLNQPGLLPADIPVQEPFLSQHPALSSNI